MRPPIPDPAAEVLVCPLAPWYYRRMGLLALLFSGMALLFLYDGKFGYPKSNIIAEKKAWFDREILGEYDAVRVQGPEQTKAWVQAAREKGWIVKASLEEPRWSDYAAPHGWPENPTFYSPEAIHEQFYYGGGLLVGAAVVGFMVLISHNKKLVGHADHMVMADGTVVKFASVHKVDKRKWDIKGLAYVWYREEAVGAEQRVTVDDLKFEGAGRVLDRLLEHFKGELIEKLPDVEEEEEGQGKSGEQTPPQTTI